MLLKQIFLSVWVSASSNKRIKLPVDPSRQETFRSYFIYNPNFVFPEEDFDLSKMRICLVLAMIFFLRGNEDVFQIKIVVFLLTQSPLSHSLNVAHRSCKIYHVCLSSLALTILQTPSLAGSLKAGQYSSNQSVFSLRDGDENSQQLREHRLYGIVQACIKSGEEGSRSTKIHYLPNYKMTLYYQLLNIVTTLWKMLQLLLMGFLVGCQEEDEVQRALMTTRKRRQTSICSQW